jgi:acetyl/propionyl-CoA carboxylase alpha subunit
VKEQINVARGEKLSFTQDDLHINGHALEIRVYAEDPANNFLPDIGRLTTYRRPTGPGVRVDDGFEEGMDIPIYYDPMIAKLITHGKDRNEAIARMVRAIDEYEITGCQTTLSFCRWAIQHEAFVSGDFDTHFVKKYFNPEVLVQESEEEMAAAALAAVDFMQKQSKATTVNTPQHSTSNWERARRNA